MLSFPLRVVARNIFRRSRSTLSNKITPKCLISPDIVKIAISKNVMFDVSEDGKGIVEVPIPNIIKATGILPEGYSVDYILDPASVIATLAKNNMTTMEQLPDDLLVQVKGAINAADNLIIAPSFVIEEKHKMVENILKEEAQAPMLEETEKSEEKS